MELKFICPQWGSKDLNFPDFLRKVADSGYHGVEMSLPFDERERETIVGSIGKQGLLLVAQHWETVTPNYHEHKTEYRKRLLNLASGNPLFINSQTGKDFFSFEQNAGLIRIADEVANTTGVQVVHETHRGKFSFAAHIAIEYLSKLPGLRIGLDLSHWCVVAESFLEDQPAAVELAIDRTDHIHARVGFSQGPQIPDPRAPEWHEAVLIHLAWWKRIIEKRKGEGKKFITITPEFGPYPYMTHLPYTKEPIANQWDVNLYMKDLIISEFSNIR